MKTIIHKMMKGFSGVIMCFLISAAQAEDLFDQANAYYTEGQFEEAVQAYETILPVSYTHLTLPTIYSV